MKKNIWLFVALCCLSGWIHAQRMELPDQFFTGKIGLGYSEKSNKSGTQQAEVSSEFTGIIGGGFHKRFGNSWLLSTTLSTTHNFSKLNISATTYTLQLPLGIGMSKWMRLFSNGNVYLVAGAEVAPVFNYSAYNYSNVNTSSNTRLLELNMGTFAALAWQPFERLILQLPLATLRYSGLFDISPPPRNSEVHNFGFSASSLGSINVIYLFKK